MSRGLVLGKFMPLHLGHELLIQSALGQVDYLTVVVYDSHPKGDYPNMPAKMRAKWIAKLYPDVENVIVRQDILSDDVSEDEKNSSVWSKSYADDLAFLGKFDYFFSSEDYGEPFAEALGAKHIIVDKIRIKIPISGTAIRNDVYDNRLRMHPLVYKDLIQKVVFVGTESTGKSTIAEVMANELNTEWVHEYGRELWVAQGLQGSFRDMLHIAETQYERELDAIPDCRDYLFCDTNPWTTLMWSKMIFGSVDSRLESLVESTKDEYLWILCDNDFAWVQDGTRELTGTKSTLFLQEHRAELKRLNVPYYEIFGTIEQRKTQLLNLLGRRSERTLKG